MKLIFLICLLIVACAFTAESSGINMAYSTIDAAVVHSGKYHILSCDDTYVILDSSRGMSIYVAGHGSLLNKGTDIRDAVITDCRLKASLAGEDGTIDIDQSYDPSARLEIIDQGPGRVAARVYFSLCTENGVPYGSGTLDLYVYSESIYLVPSIYVDYKKGITSITKAGLYTSVPGKNAELIVKGSKLIPSGSSRFVPFGEDAENFSITVNNPGRFSMKIGWLRNSYPSWMYMNNIAENPETDELYEKWPHWITQRGNPLSWKAASNSGLSAGFMDRSLEQLQFLWANGDSLKIPEGSYKAFNGVMALFLAPNSSEVQTLWTGHEKPLKPEVKAGDFKYYNEFEGVYEIDSGGGDVDVTFNNLTGSNSRKVFVRIWNLEGKGACEIKVNNKPVPFGLYNDGDIIEDPMVSIVKHATGPARYASVAFVVAKGDIIRLTMKHMHGIQFVYQMYSGLETYETWSDTCVDKPLFRFHLKKGEIYHATLPGKHEYAFFKFPMYWLKNGVNRNTFMNHTRGFIVNKNGPDYLQFTYTGVNLQGTGLSKYSVTVPYERDCLTFDVTAEFTVLDDGVRWTSVEYCNVYPFDHVYRRDFFYDDVIFLNSSGEFDRVGAGAWGGGFETTMEPERLGYYAEPVRKEGPGTRTPASSDGTVWILGNNTERGNILYRRGDWTPSPGSRSVFSLCNAWMDIHNTITGRQQSSTGETISYSVELFGGPLPSLDKLNAMYRKAAGGKTVKKVVMVNYSLDGEIEGFVVE